MVEQNATQRLRVVKYRGSPHGANEVPFVIDESGFSVLPITSLGLEHGVSAGRLSSGVADLDEMLGGPRAVHVLLAIGLGAFELERAKSALAFKGTEQGVVITNPPGGSRL